MLDKRLQVLVDENRLARLRRESKRQGAPIGELVRRAIDHHYPAGDEGLTPAEAARRILSWEPGPGREPDWEEQKRELLDELSGGSPA